MSNNPDKSEMILNCIYKQLRCTAHVYKWEDSYYIAEIYNIPSIDREKMKDQIIELQDEIFPGMDFFILPMVYTVEETRKYFDSESVMNSLQELTRMQQSLTCLPECHNPSAGTDILEEYKAA